ncbi:MAG: ATP-binding protein [Candidatus Babeliaceae bacterium]
MFIQRILTQKIVEASSEFPVIAVMGPRQSGKTTLVQMVFANHKYVSLEDYDIREFAQDDPRKFLAEYPTESGLILDEIQHAPELLSYIQTIVDREKKNGYFIVTGSQNFLVDQAITQTLAGRMAVFTLLPLSLSELANASLLPAKIETLVYKGSYPKVHAQQTSVERLYTNYMRLYVERDVRQIKNVSDLSSFQKFMRLCAGRIGQILNATSLGNDCGINQSTVKAWLSLLEASYVIFLLYPYYKNFGKRLIKAPKIYFVDTGVACSLLKIRSEEELADHYMRGGLVESFIVSDLLKQQCNLEQQPSLYFWRDKTGHEVDCIIDESKYPVPVEIKAGKTITTDFFKDLNYWQSITDTPQAPCYLIYGGNENQKRTAAEVVSWQSAGTLIEKLS